MNTEDKIQIRIATFHAEKRLGRKKVEKRRLKLGPEKMAEKSLCGARTILDTCRGY